MSVRSRFCVSYSTSLFSFCIRPHVVSFALRAVYTSPRRVCSCAPHSQFNRSTCVHRFPQQALDLAALNTAITTVKTCHPNLSFWMEPGRYISAESGVLVTRVNQVRIWLYQRSVLRINMTSFQLYRLLTSNGRYEAHYSLFPARSASLSGTHRQGKASFPLIFTHSPLSRGSRLPFPCLSLSLSFSSAHAVPSSGPLHLHLPLQLTRIYCPFPLFTTVLD